MCSEVGIDHESLPYGLPNEIMDHPRSDGGPESNEIGCTKIFKECTEGPKMRFEVRINSQSLCYGFLKEIMDHPC